LVVIIAQRHTFATHFYVNRTIYISLYVHVLHLKQFTPRSIIKFSFHTFFFSLSFFSYIYPTFILACSSECLYLSDCSIDSFVTSFFTCSTSFCFTLHLFYLFLHIYTHLSPFSNFCLLSFSLTFYTIYLFSCRRVQEVGKSLMSDIAGFMGRLSNTTRGFPFPTNIRHGDMAFRKPFLFCHLVEDYLADAFWRPRPIQCTIRVVPVPSGIRQFRLFRSLSSSRSLNAFIALVTVERKRDTRIAQRQITQEFNSTLNSLRPEMRYGCNQASIVHKWLIQQNRINRKLFILFLWKITWDYIEIKLIEKHFFFRMR